MDEWDHLTQVLIKQEYKISIGDLESKLMKKQIRFSETLIKNLWDSFKLNPNDKAPYEQRLVVVKDLVSRKLNRKGKRIDELIQLQ